MVKFVFGLIFVVIALILVAGSWLGEPSTTDSNGDVRGGEARFTARIVAAVVLVIAALLIIFASLTSIGTRNVGVETTFGRPHGHLTNGLHWKAPWSKVTQLDGAVQTDTYATDGSFDGKQQDGAISNCVHVKVSRQATMCINVSVRYQINPQGVDTLFQQYHTDTAIQDNLVLRDLQSAVAQVYADYDPLALDGNGNSLEPNSAVEGQKVQTLVQQQLGDLVTVDNVLIPIFYFDDATAGKVSAFQQAVINTKTATQNVLTAQQTAKANQILASTATSQSAQQQCLTVLADAEKDNYQLPAGFSCFGSGSAVVVPSK